MYVCVSESCHDQITEDADLGRKTDGLKREDSSLSPSLPLSHTHAHIHTLYALLARGPYSQGNGGLDRQSNETDHLHKDRRQTWTQPRQLASTLFPPSGRW